MEDFVALCRQAEVETVVDVRRYPASRRHPHFAREAMEGWLAGAGLGYRWLPGLGGRRRSVPGSPNVALRNLQFRGYADHMATEAFAAACRHLLEVAASSCVAVLCAESVWWRCHRRLLADHLVLVAGVDVNHILPDGRLQSHTPAAEARVDGDHLVYDGGRQPTLL